jgi:hypothetical protein
VLKNDGMSVLVAHAPINVDMEQCGIVGVRYTSTLLPETCMSSGLTTRSCSSETGCSGSVMERSRSVGYQRCGNTGEARGSAARRTKDFLRIDLLSLVRLPLRSLRPQTPVGVDLRIPLGMLVPQKSLPGLLAGARGVRGREDGGVDVVQLAGHGVLCDLGCDEMYFRWGV